MIDPRLRVLQMVDELGTVTAAAEALAYTPSAVSHQLRQLAGELGVRLLTPSGRRVELTAAGRILLRHAAALHAQRELALAELAHHAEQPTGSFTLYGFSTAAMYLLPPAAASLRDQHPAVTPRVVEAEPSECFRRLLAGDADLAVVVATAGTPSVRDPRFEVEHLLTDPLDVLVPADHRLAGAPDADLRDLAGDEWIVGSPGSAYASLTTAVCAGAGFSPFVAHRAYEWETGGALVGHGLGVALIPRLFRIPEEWAVRRVRLRGDPPPARHLLIATRAGGGGHPLVREAREVMAGVGQRLLDRQSGAGSSAGDVSP